MSRWISVSPQVELSEELPISLPFVLQFVKIKSFPLLIRWPWTTNNLRYDKFCFQFSKSVSFLWGPCTNSLLWSRFCSPLGGVLFQRSQPADSRPFWLEFTNSLLDDTTYVSVSPPPIPTAPFYPSLHQRGRHTGPSSKLDCPPMPPPWSGATWSLSAKFTAMLSPTSSGSNTWRRMAVNMGPTGCPISRFWRWGLSGSEGTPDSGLLNGFGHRSCWIWEKMILLFDWPVQSVFGN